MRGLLYSSIVWSLFNTALWLIHGGILFSLFLPYKEVKGHLTTSLEIQIQHTLQRTLYYSTCCTAGTFFFYQTVWAELSFARANFQMAKVNSTNADDPDWNKKTMPNTIISSHPSCSHQPAILHTARGNKNSCGKMKEGRMWVKMEYKRLTSNPWNRRSRNNNDHRLLRALSHSFLWWLQYISRAIRALCQSLQPVMLVLCILRVCAPAGMYFCTVGLHDFTSCTPCSLVYCVYNIMNTNDTG